MKPPAVDPERLWNIAEVSEYLQIPVASIYKMTARKARLPIPHVRISGRIRFRRVEIDEWLSLLTVSNLARLRTLRRKTTHEVTNGHDPSPSDARR